MSKPRSRAADFGVYLAVRVVVCILEMLSPRAAAGFAALLARLAYQIDRRHRRVADDNLRLAFPGRYTDPQRDAVVRAVYRHFCTLLLDIVHLPRRLHVQNWREHLDLKTHGRPLVEALIAGRPLLMVTGHFGNWEMGGYTLGLLGFRTYAIARPLDNPFLDDYLRRFRERTGQSILAKNDDYDRIQEVLAQQGVLGVLADQDAGSKGQFVDFCGRPASTHKAVALLALQYGVPMVVLGIPRIGEPLRFRVVVEDVIRPEDYADRPDAPRAITQRFTTALERLVTAYPEQYFWLHRRWKHAPPTKKAKKAA